VSLFAEFQDLQKGSSLEVEELQRKLKASEYKVS